MAASMDLAGRRVAVVGLGKSGLAVARFCAARGAHVTACDDRTEAALAKELSTLQSELSAGSVSLAVGGISAESLLGADLIVLSPGVPPNRPAIANARAKGIAITGEIELASRFISAPIVGITGTNGKSTVTSLCGAIAEATGRPSFCGGNLGTPLIEAVGTKATSEDGIVVVELSSYQLETVDTLRCHAATILNLTPDHLDRYDSLDAYGDAKARIFRHLPLLGTRVWNADDPVALALCHRSQGPQQPAYLFSTRGPVPTQSLMERSLRLGGWLQGSDLVLSGVEGGLAGCVDSRGATLPTEHYPTSALQLVGRHNLSNALAAFLLMRASGLATAAQVLQAASQFHALPHRMQLVGEVGGILFYDDSKGTNVDAVVAGLDGFPRPFVLIAGGRDKGGSYAPLRSVLEQAPTRGVITIGEAAPLIGAAMTGTRFPVTPAVSLPEAVAQAVRLCQPGDAVVLSPACSSFDMFRDYAHRAQVFCEALAALPGARLLAPAHSPEATAAPALRSAQP
mgnify:CR=1 FL=1